jgi:ribosome-binding protein aMBF1 (putative translation factor)
MKTIRSNIAVRKRVKTSTRRRDAVDLLESMIGNDRKLQELANQATLNALVAQLIYRARTDAGLTQSRLAKLIGTRQSVISRLEDADYDGHSLSMLGRIAQALGKRLEVRLVDASKNRAA